MKITVINGPNLNLLGTREPHLYGSLSLADIEQELRKLGADHGIALVFYQSNIEGELVNALQQAARETDGVILNAAAYTHTSVAIRDAVAAIAIPAVEVHLTNPASREPFRRVSMLAGVSAGSISGFGADSYALALLWFARKTG
jgi:3-dehydroquinate dehydratase II